ncbi:hypothetical protein, partial [Leptospira noguchii]|uniref:hypothetical protein n=1 Tax=Leptospira noguchii TaxID=28182 RepID=UPI0009E33D46
CKFAIYGILEQDQNIQIFETINPSILFMCPSSKLKQRRNIALRFFHTIHSLELKTQSGNTKYSEFLLC